MSAITDYLNEVKALKQAEYDLTTGQKNYFNEKIEPLLKALDAIAKQMDTIDQAIKLLQSGEAQAATSAKPEV
jgi:prefoldin subunit 5